MRNERGQVVSFELQFIQRVGRSTLKKYEKRSFLSLFMMKCIESLRKEIGKKKVKIIWYCGTTKFSTKSEVGQKKVLQKEYLDYIGCYGSEKF